MSVTISRTSSLESCKRLLGASKKRRIAEVVTPTYGGFRRYELDKVAGSTRRYLLCTRGLFREGRSRSGSCTRQFEI